MKIKYVEDECVDNPEKALMILWSKLKRSGQGKYIDKKETYGDSWLHVPPEYLLRRMEEEFYEFRQAVEHNGTVKSALEELQDLNNFALMFLIRAYQEGYEDVHGNDENG